METLGTRTLVRASLAALFTVPLVASCMSETAADSTTVAGEPLVNGTPSTAGYAGFLTSPLGSCTATLIGRMTALTAAHCANTGDPVNFCIFPGGNTSGSSICSPGTAVRNPNYDGKGDFDDDVAVVNLNLDMVKATVSSTWPQGVTPLLIGGPVQEGEIVTLTGYGCDQDNSDSGKGQQRTGETSISNVDDLTFECNDSSRAHGCEGDSGGPAALPFGCAVGTIVGSEWYLGTTYRFNRTDTKVGWIQSVAQDSTVHQCEEPMCGDGLCQWPESCTSCPQDCPNGCPRCGDGVCNGTETTRSCPQDCPVGTCPSGKLDCCDDGICRTLALCKRLGCL